MKINKDYYIEKFTCWNCKIQWKEKFEKGLLGKDPAVIVPIYCPKCGNYHEKIIKKNDKYYWKKIKNKL